MLIITRTLTAKCNLRRWAVHLPGVLLLLAVCLLANARLSSAGSAPPFVRAPAPHALRAISRAPGSIAAQPDAAGDPITVVGWNIGLDDADIGTVAARIGAFEGVDLWGIAEVNRTNAVSALEAAAEEGEVGDFKAVLGPSGGGMRLVALYDDTRFDLLEWYELEDINTTGNARAPLVLHLSDTVSGQQFLFMVNHLYRSRDDERHTQAQMLGDWAEGKALPVIAVGDYNFDWEVVGGDGAHDRGYDLMTEGGAWEWVRPVQLVTSQCSGWPCRYDSVLDFVFSAGPARAWRAESEIVVAPRDFPDDATTSDHRPVLARFWPQEAEGSVPAKSSAPSLLLPTPTPDARLAAPTPVPQPTAPPPPSGPVANDRANLRGGPGTNYPVVGGARAGQSLAVVGRNEAGDWYQLADGSWIAAFLVDGAPNGLGVVAAPAPVVVEQPTAAPPPVQAAAPAPAPVRAAEQPPSNCDPSYPTLCIPRGIGDLDCGDIGARRFPVVGSDPHRFDGDHDGVGCESR